MPNEVTLYACGVWFAVGLFAGTGWALGSVLISRLIR